MRAVASAIFLVLGTAFALSQVGCERPSDTSTSAEANAVHANPLAEGTSTSSLAAETPSTANLPRLAESLAFRDVHESVGVDFVYRNGAAGRALMVEATGGAAGWLDLDRDGLWDLFLPQGGNPAWKSADENPNDALYRSEGEAFVDVADMAGIVDTGYGQAVAIGDFDNDGFDDIYVTNVGKNTFFINQGDGTFREEADGTGVQDERWSCTAAWSDLDGDSDLDLFVCNYLAYDPYAPIPCDLDDGTPTTCHPNLLQPVTNSCFENLGDGTFREVGKQWGLTGRGSKSLSVIIADLDGDDLPDVFVANDTTANFFFKNLGSGRFKEQGLLAGCALSGDGLFQASMGIAVGDYDHNGYPDLYVTHFTHDSNTLYSNLGSRGFQDSTRSAGLHTPTLPYLGFGTIMADFDRNGLQDMFIANGHTDPVTKSDAMYEMPAQMFTWNGVRFVECSTTAGPYFQRRVVGRGVASCDWDGDGDLDLAVVNQNDPVAMLENDASTGHWLNVQLVGTRSNRRGINTKATLHQGGRRLVQELVGGSSYNASNEPCIYFGLVEDEPVRVELSWPSGVRQTLEGVTVDQTLTIREPATL